MNLEDTAMCMHDCVCLTFLALLHGSCRSHSQFAGIHARAGHTYLAEAAAARIASAIVCNRHLTRASDSRDQLKQNIECPSPDGGASRTLLLTLSRERAQLFFIWCQCCKNDLILPLQRHFRLRTFWGAEMRSCDCGALSNAHLKSSRRTAFDRDSLSPKRWGRARCGVQLFKPQDKSIREWQPEMNIGSLLSSSPSHCWT